MAASSDDIFGAGSSTVPATPGTYGEPAPRYRLPEATKLGPVRLGVSELDRSVRFYETVLGMRSLHRNERIAVLGSEGGGPLVELEQLAEPRGSGRVARLGLYHFAILLPDRASLGSFVRHLAEIGIRAGAGDHLVSEAFYINDPDGLGIEIYADRPRESWRRVGRELMMSTDPVDVDGLLSAAGDTPWNGMPAGTVMGHVHLHVGDLAEAERFYSEGVGFDRMTWSYPGALFMSAGGYHHHVGTNTWAGPTARPADAHEPRLIEWTIELPTAADLQALVRNLETSGFGVEAYESRAVARDPWGIRVVFTTTGGAPESGTAGSGSG